MNELSPLLNPHLQPTQFSTSELVTGVPQRPRLLFGEVDASFGSEIENLHNGLNQLPSAVINVRPDLAPLIDFFAPVNVISGDSSQPLFSGATIRADLENSAASTRLRVAASGMASLKETGVAKFVHWRMPAIDLIYMLSRGGGLTKENIKISSSQMPPLETFEVMQPVFGSTVARPITVGKVRLVPAKDFRLPAPLTHDPAWDELAARFHQADSIAITYVNGFHLLHDAEVRGLESIAPAVAWLRVRSHYGASMWPSLIIRPFDRAAARANVRITNTAYARGMLTGRAWLRDTENPSKTSHIDVSDVVNGAMIEPVPDPTFDLACLACARAADDSILPLERVVSLWDALEFYASGVKPRELFSRHQRKSILASFPADLDKTQKNKFEWLVGQLNSSPLLQKIRDAVEIDAVPITESEMTLLQVLRKKRNDLVHGRGTDEPGREDLDYAVSIVCRMLVYRAAKSRFSAP